MTLGISKLYLLTPCLFTLYLLKQGFRSGLVTKSASEKVVPIILVPRVILREAISRWYYQRIYSAM